MKDRPLLNKGKKENILQNNNTGLNNKCLSTENIRLVENKSRPRLEYQFYIILMSYFFNFLYCLSNILLLFSRLSDVNRQRVFFFYKMASFPLSMRVFWAILVPLSFSARSCLAFPYIPLFVFLDSAFLTRGDTMPLQVVSYRPFLPYDQTMSVFLCRFCRRVLALFQLHPDESRLGRASLLFFLAS